MHDGSKVLLRTLETDYDPSEPMQALARLHQARDENQLLTGIVHLRPEKPSFTKVLNMVDKPLALLDESETRPSREALEEIMQELR
jgi:2-oxoglutarate/2-oxoacid ferredoxin oxidoreductase subunit beta